MTGNDRLDNNSGNRRRSNALKKKTVIAVALSTGLAGCGALEPWFDKVASREITLVR